MHEPTTSARNALLRFVPAPARWVYFLLFTVSGFAGLIYESIWSHYLKLFLGHAAYAQSLVLIIFMGGLGLGSWLAARFGTRWRLPILIYALVEAAIGLLALVFHPVFVEVTGAFYATVFPAIGSPGLASVLKWTAAAALMVPQTVLLGMTFPLLAGGVLRRFPAQPGATLALLYFTNSIGAAAGVLASGFWLIGLVGLPGTIRVAGLLNIGLAVLVALLVAADPARAARPAAEAPGQTAAARGTAGLFLVAAFVTGLASFIYQIGWIRMLALVLGSTTRSFELMLSAFITGLAFGGLWSKWRIDTVAEPLKYAAWVQVLMGTAAVLSIPVYGLTFEWMTALLKALQQNDSGYSLFTLVSQGIALAVMLPATFLAGMTLPLFTHVMMRDGAGEAAIGQVYAANTVGAIVGVLFAMHVGLPLLGLKNLIATGAMLDIGLGLVLLYLLSEQARLRRVAPAAALGLGTVALVLATATLAPTMLTSGVFRYARASVNPVMTVPFYKDGKTATVAVARHPLGELLIHTNGKPDASIQLNIRLPPTDDEGTMVLAAALPLAYQQDVRRIANIGLGSGLTSHVLLTDPRVETLDTIEIEPAMIEGARLFGARVGLTFEDPRSRLHVEDAKAFFPLHRHKYDVIVAEPSNPWVSGVASLFSTEFYQLVGDYLEDDGILVQWLQFYEFSDELFFSVLKALAPHFSDFVIYHNPSGGDGIILARKTGTLGTPDFARILRGRTGIELRRVGIQTPGDLGLRRALGKEVLATLATQYPVPANSDYYPYLDLNAGAALFSKSHADFIAAWTEGPVPALEMLGGGDWGGGPVTGGSRKDGRVISIVAAATIYGMVVRGQPPPENVQLRASLQTAAAALAGMASNCTSGRQERAFLTALHEVAMASLPFLRVTQATELVAAVLPAACQASASPRVQAWVRLYRAVAGRSGPAMVAAATPLLQQDAVAGDPRREYLLTVLLLGHLSAGAPDSALRAWQVQGGEALFRGRKAPPHLDQLLKLAAGSLLQVR